MMVCVGKLHEPFFIYIGMILSTLDLSYHGFVFRLFSQKT